MELLTKTGTYKATVINSELKPMGDDLAWIITLEVPTGGNIYHAVYRSVLSPDSLINFIPHVRKGLSISDSITNEALFTGGKYKDIVGQECLIAIRKKVTSRGVFYNPMFIEQKNESELVESRLASLFAAQN